MIDGLKTERPGVLLNFRAGVSKQSRDGELDGHDDVSGTSARKISCAGPASVRATDELAGVDIYFEPTSTKDIHL